MDSDGVLEIVIASYWGNGYILDFGGSNPSGPIAPWPMLANRQTHIGCYRTTRGRAVMDKRIYTPDTDFTAIIKVWLTDKLDNLISGLGSANFDVMLDGDLVSLSFAEISTGYYEATIDISNLEIGVHPVVVTVTDPATGLNEMYRTVIRKTHPADLNRDGKVDIKDIAVVAAALGSFEDTDPDKPGNQPSHDWDPIADINHDGKVDIRDVSFVAIHFGWTSG